ncbi:hypothetical protein EBU94_01720, partial [bacterium]|nr:hypothetical protein [bacterium]
DLNVNVTGPVDDRYKRELKETILATVKNEMTVNNGFRQQVQTVSNNNLLSNYNAPTLVG